MPHDTPPNPGAPPRTHRVRAVVATGVGAAAAALLVVTLLDAPPARADVISYGQGIVELSAPLVVPDGTTLVGAGQGQTILRAAAGYTGPLVVSAGTLDPSPETVHHPGIQIRDLTIDGAGSASRGIYLIGADGLDVEDVVVTGTTDTAIEHAGLPTGAPTDGQTWSNVTASDCGGWGLVNGGNVVNAAYVNVRATRCANGIAIAHPQAQSNGIQVTDNIGDGLWLTQTMGSDVVNVRATGNGANGIHVQGMVSSTGSGWLSMNNGVRDVWFDAAATSPAAYGTTRASTVNGLLVGHTACALGPQDGASEQYLVVDPGVDVVRTAQRILTKGTPTTSCVVPRGTGR